MEKVLWRSASRCVCVRRISLGGEDNVLYPVLPSFWLWSYYPPPPTTIFGLEGSAIISCRGQIPNQPPEQAVKTWTQFQRSSLSTAAFPADSVFVLENWTQSLQNSFFLVSTHRVTSCSITRSISSTSMEVRGKGKGKGRVLPTVLLTWVRLMTRSALQSRKWQLIGKRHWYRGALNCHPLPAQANNWTHGAAHRYTTTPISHTRPSPHSS